MSGVTNPAKRIEKLVHRVQSELKPGLDETVQTELANLLNLLPDLDKSKHTNLVGLAEIAASALLGDEPNQELATEVRRDIAKRIYAPPLRRILGVLRGGGSPPTVVILGLGVLLYFAFPLVTMLAPRLAGRNEILGIDASMLGLVALAGALGSIVSIMVRIQDFSAMQDVDSSILFLTGLFKPVIGMSFALFVFVAMSSGLVPVTINPGSERFYFAAVSFIAGFSERFARDVVTTTTDAIPGS